MKKKTTKKTSFQKKLIAGIKGYGEFADAVSDAYYGKPGKKKKGSYWGESINLPNAFE